MAKKSARVTPAQLVAIRFGGVRKAGRLLGSEFIVSKWIERGGRIPNSGNSSAVRNYDRLLQIAKEHDVKLTMDEILNGGVP